MSKLVNPRGGKTTNWRAGCGRSARPVRREGESQALPTPIKSACRTLRDRSLKQSTKPNQVYTDRLTHPHSDKLTNMPTLSKSFRTLVGAAGIELATYGLEV